MHSLLPSQRERHLNAWSTKIQTERRNSAVDFLLVLFTSSRLNQGSDNDWLMSTFKTTVSCGCRVGKGHQDSMPAHTIVTEATEFIFLRLLTRHAKLMPKINKSTKAGYSHLVRTRTSQRKQKLIKQKLKFPASDDIELIGTDSCHKKEHGFCWNQNNKTVIAKFQYNSKSSSTRNNTFPGYMQFSEIYYAKNIQQLTNHVLKRNKGQTELNHK